MAGDPAVRRSFINQVASLLIPGYANRLQSFTHVAKQRAALLKQLGQWQRAGSPIDAALSGLEIWTGQFIEAGVALSRDRQRIIAELNKSFGPLYARLAGVAGDLPSNAEIQDAAQDGGEQAAVEYVPSFDEIDPWNTGARTLDKPAFPAHLSRRGVSRRQSDRPATR